MSTRTFTLWLCIICCACSWHVCRGAEAGDDAAALDSAKSSIIYGDFVITAGTIYQRQQGQTITADDGVQMRYPLPSAAGSQPTALYFDAASLIIQPSGPPAPGTAGSAVATGMLVTVRDAAFSTCTLPVHHRHYELHARTLTLDAAKHEFVAEHISFRLGGLRLITLSRLHGHLGGDPHSRILYPTFTVGSNSLDGSYLGARVNLPAGEQDLEAYARVGTEEILRGRLVLSRTIALPSKRTVTLSLLGTYHEEAVNRLTETRNVSITRIPAVQFRADRLPVSLFGVPGITVSVGGGGGRYREDPSRVTLNRWQAWGVVDLPRNRLGAWEWHAGLGGQAAVNGGETHCIGVGLLSLGTPIGAERYAGISYLHRSDSGETPFIFDRVDIHNEIFTELEIPARRHSAWRFNVMNRFDLDQQRSRAFRATAIYGNDCFSYGLGYDSISHDVSISILANGLDSFRSGGGRIGFPL